MASFCGRFSIDISMYINLLLPVLISCIFKLTLSLYSLPFLTISFAFYSINCNFVWKFNLIHELGIETKCQSMILTNASLEPSVTEATTKNTLKPPERCIAKHTGIDIDRRSMCVCMTLNDFPIYFYTKGDFSL